MKVVLVDMKYLPLARAMFRKAGFFLTVRNGSIFTINMYKQRKTIQQHNYDAEKILERLYVGQNMRCNMNTEKNIGQRLPKHMVIKVNIQLH